MAEAKKKKARVLVACDLGQPNDIIEVDSTQEKALADVVDTSPEAVAYAESIVEAQ